MANTVSRFMMKTGNATGLPFDKKSDADSFIRMIEARKYDQSRIQQKLIKPKITIERAIADFWLDKSGIQPKSVGKYQYELSQFKTFCIQRNIQFVNDFTREHADEFRYLLIESKAAPKTVNSYLSRLRAVFMEQVNRDNLVRNPTSHLKNVPLKRKSLIEREDEYYTKKEIQAFFSKSIVPEYKIAFMAFFLTGLRFEELAHLTWDKINFQTRMIMVRSANGFLTKTPSGERDIPISDILYPILQEGYKMHQSVYVFPSESGQKLQERFLLRVCKLIAKEASITKNATLHKFRHTFNSLLSQFGVAYEIREYLLGHKPKGSLTAHYTKLDPTQFHSIINLLNPVLEEII